MKNFSENEESMLNKVNQIGMEIGGAPDENIIFFTLSPYLDPLMKLLKQLKPDEMQLLFIKYEGVMRVMRMIEDSAKKMEQELGLK